MVDFRDLDEECKKREVENNFMINMLETVVKRTRDKKANLLLLTMKIDQKEREITDYFIDRRNVNRKKLDRTINFYEQINKLYDDFKKDLEIEKEKEN